MQQSAKIASTLYAQGDYVSYKLNPPALLGMSKHELSIILSFEIKIKQFSSFSVRIYISPFLWLSSIWRRRADDWLYEKWWI